MRVLRKFILCLRLIPIHKSQISRLFPIILLGVAGILMVENREKKEEGRGKER